MQASRPPTWIAWEPAGAAAAHSGHEITRHTHTNPRAASTYRTDYDEKPLPPRRVAETLCFAPRPLGIDKSIEKAAYAWPSIDNAATPVQPPLPSGPTEVVPWPVVSFHGPSRPAHERAMRDAAINDVEEEAWRREAKVLPERQLYHGEDEITTERKPPLSRVFGYPSRPHGTTRQTRTAAVSRYGSHADTARRRTNVASRPDIKWRQHEVLRRRQPCGETNVADPVVHAGGIRSRAKDFHATKVASLLGPESAPSASPTRHQGLAANSSRRDPHGLLSTKEWKRVLHDRSRSAMPGAAKEAAAGGARAPGSNWVRTRRPAPTGAGSEPIAMGMAARPRSGAHKLAAWSTARASQYR